MLTAPDGSLHDDFARADSHDLRIVSDAYCYSPSRTSLRPMQISYLFSFLESVPEVSAKLKEPNTKEQKFEDVVKSAEQAAVLVLVY
jgi:hypothetical protein